MNEDSIKEELDSVKQIYKKFHFQNFSQKSHILDSKRFIFNILVFLVKQYYLQMNHSIEFVLIEFL